MVKGKVIIICAFLVLLILFGVNILNKSLEKKTSDSDLAVTYVDVELHYLSELDADFEDFINEHSIKNFEDFAAFILISSNEIKQKYEKTFHCELPDVDYEETYLVLSLGREADFVSVYLRQTSEPHVYERVETRISKSKTYTPNKLYCYMQIPKHSWEEVIIL